MDVSRPNISKSLQSFHAFVGSGLAERIAQLERLVKGCGKVHCGVTTAEAGVTSELLAAAYDVKVECGQVNVVIHAVGILLLLPQILETDEQVEYVSLGAAAAGKRFDLETDQRVAEFKFTHWKGRDAVRQDNLFKDFYLLAEHPTPKRKEIYVLETARPLKFLRGRRAISTVLDGPHLQEFLTRYGRTYLTVGDYFTRRDHRVSIYDASPLVPELL
jgi:hypothetical protein